MAQLDRVIVFDSGTLLEADDPGGGTGGSPSVQTTTKRSGDYALSLPAAGSTWFSAKYETLRTPSDAHRAISVWVYFSASTSTNNTWFLETRDTASSFTTWMLARNSSNQVELWNDNAGTGTLLATTSAVSSSTWYKIRLYWHHTTGGDSNFTFEFDNSVVETEATTSASSWDFVPSASSPDRLIFWGDSTAGGAQLFDLATMWSGVHTTNRLADLPDDGAGADLEKWSFQGNTSPTTSGTALDAGSWTNTQEQPFSTTNEAEYTASSADGYVETDGGSRAGPSGSSDIDGNDNIVAALFQGQFYRGNGGGTTHNFRYGKSGGTTQTFDMGDLSNSSPGDWKAVLSTDKTNVVPLSTNYFRLGMQVSGARDLNCIDMMGTILHVTSGSTPTVVNQTSAASMSMSGNQANVNAETIVDQGSAASMSLTGQTAGINLDVNIGATAASMAMSTNQADVNAEAIVDATVASMSFVGQTADVNASLILEALAASMAMSTNAATIQLTNDIIVSAAVASMTMSTNQADVNAEISIDAAVASMAMSTNQADVNASLIIESTVASMGMSGQQADVNAEISIDANFDSMTMSGVTADVNASLILEAAVASMTMGTNQAEISLGVIVQAAVAAMTMSTNQANVNAEAIVDAITASMALSTQLADVNASSISDGSLATMTLVGQPAGISLNVNVNAGTATMTMTTNVATIVTATGTVISAAVATMTMTTNQASVNASLIIEANNATMIMTTFPMLLTGAPYGSGGGTSGPRRVVSLGVIN